MVCTYFDNITNTILNFNLIDGFIHQEETMKILITRIFIRKLRVLRLHPLKVGDKNSTASGLVQLKIQLE